MSNAPLLPESTPSSSLERFFARVGAPAISVWEGTRSLSTLFIQTFKAIFRGRMSWRAFLEQCFEIGNRSVPFILATLGVLGFISVYQIAMQIQKILPEFSMLGAAFIQTMWREFAPTITGLMVATRVGSGIAAQIGSMVVTEQVDALRMCNADPVAYLIAPRTLASGLMVVALSILGVIAATITGMLIAKTGFGVSYRTFLNFSLLSYTDIAVGMIKAFSYGIAIPVIAGKAGLDASGGSAGVGQATTKAVVATSFAVIFIDFIISGLSFLFET